MAKNNYKKATKFLNEVLSKKKTVFEMALWVRDHAQFLEWRCNYPHDKIYTIIQPYLEISNHLSEKGMGENKDVLRDFRMFSVETIIELEKCNSFN